MGLFGLFKNRRQKEKTCEDCLNFRPEKDHIDFEGGEHMTIYKSSCKIYGEFTTFHSGNLNKKVIDESVSYKAMLIERARGCKDFKIGNDPVRNDL
jgi:hypothetical protein